MSLDQRAAAWKAKYPDRASALRSVLVQFLGMRGHSESTFALRVLEPLEVAILDALLTRPENESEVA